MNINAKRPYWWCQEKREALSLVRRCYDFESKRKKKNASTLCSCDHEMRLNEKEEIVFLIEIGHSTLRPLDH